MGEGVMRAILILSKNLSEQAEKTLSSIKTDTHGRIIIETFLERELLVNITEHILVPKHQLLTNAEKIQLLNRYKLREAQIPRILSNDPVARYLGIDVGDVVRIIRPSETAGRYVTYRICVDG